jgi:agmatine/peptidylarginine deiminase
MKHLYFLLLSSLLLLHPAFAQQSLPKGLSESEQNIISQHQFRTSQAILPPPAAVRAAAEWEEVEYLVVAWFSENQNILRQIVAAGVAECKVIIATQNETSVANYLTANGVPLDNVIFMDAPANSIWIRDYGGNTIYTNDVGERALADWIYNRPRPLDNMLPSAHASLVGIPIYQTNSGTDDLVNTGGNYMSDGLGNAFASELILEENSEGNPYNVSAKSEAQIDAIMQNYMGISNYIKMPVLPYDGIHHIDMHMKLLDEETLLVSRYPPGVADGPQIESNIAYVLENYTSPFGTPYNVHWIDAPPSTGGSYPDTGGYYRTFSNSVIVNKTIMVPTYRPEVDAPALALYQELMPGYTIVGIDVDNGSNPLIASSGAIHCITHTIGVADPLLIVHQPVDTAGAGTMVEISASIKHNSGVAGAIVFWREEGTIEWNQTAMSWAGESAWIAAIAMPFAGSGVEYYIHATANSGKQLSRPIVAPDGFWKISGSALSVVDFVSLNISSPYPNPARDVVNFSLTQVQGPIKLTITNLLGQQLYEKAIASGNGVLSLELNAAWQGTLLFTFEGDFGKVVRKVIKF